MSIEAFDIQELYESLRKASEIKEIPERHIHATAVLTNALATVGVHPILVGGGAVEFYTGGAYSTGDIDLVAPEGKDTAVIMVALGFDKRGKNWVNEELKMFVEFPNRVLRSGESFLLVDVDGVMVRVVTPEDLVIERLKAFKLYGATVDAVNAILIMDSDVYFEESVAAKRASKEDVRDAYDGLQAILKRIHRGVSIEEGQANAMLEALLEKVRT